jgi:hypothetical protein
VRIAKVGQAEFGFKEDSPAEVGSVEVGLVEVSIAKVRSNLG